MALVMVIGEMGTGKTLFLVRLAAKHQKVPIYSNFHIKLPNVKLIDPEDLLMLKYEKCAVFMDEAYAWMESRISHSKINRFMSYILFQSRKRGIDIFLTAQLLSSIDVRFRNLASAVISAERLPDGFRYTVYRDIEGMPIGSFFLNEKTASKYYSLYDTTEIVEPFNAKELWVELIANNPQKYSGFLESMAEKYLSKHDKISKASVLDFVVSEGFNKKVATDLYAKLKAIEMAENEP